MIDLCNQVSYSPVLRYCTTNTTSETTGKHRDTIGRIARVDRVSGTQLKTVLLAKNMTYCFRVNTDA